jgi:hypothetical protein
MGGGSPATPLLILPFSTSSLEREDRDEITLNTVIPVNGFVQSSQQWVFSCVIPAMGLFFFLFCVPSQEWGGGCL